MKSFQSFFYDVLINEADALQKTRSKVNVIGPEILPMQPEGETPSAPSSPKSSNKGSGKVSRGPVRPSTIERAFKKATEKGYKTASGEITPKGIQTYYARRKSQGYGDPGKPLKGGSETLKKANELTTNITSEKKKIIKDVVKKIETKYPTPQSVQKSTPLGFKQFSQSVGTGAQRRAQAASDAAQDITKYEKRRAYHKRILNAIDKLPPEPSTSTSTKPKITGDVEAPSKSSKVTTNFTTSPRSSDPPKTPTVKPARALTKSVRVAGAVGTGLQGYLDYKSEREKGSSKLRSAAAGTASVLGGALGGALGSVAGPIGGLAGATAGTYAAQKAFDVAAGANAKERASMATLKRQSQAGKALVGTGGRTTFSSKGKDMFMSTGAPDARKTVQLAKTSIIKDPTTGKQEVGYLAKQGGQAVYKRGQDPSSLAKTSTNWLERVGRTIAPGAYKQQDIKQTQSKLAAAQKSDAAMKTKLGIK